MRAARRSSWSRPRAAPSRAADSPWKDASRRAQPVPNKLGKRYSCAECGAEVLVTRAGDGELSCHGEPMDVLQPKPLPSSD
ncbi:MAG: hypothetical protein E6G17_03620 [Actinobacteria bacterium]|nr:MAG: hypothetical protein E6G17_03620 [Actinomycetota bacterium]